MNDHSILFFKNYSKTKYFGKSIYDKGNIAFFHLGKNSSVSSLYKNYTIACQNVTTEQV